MFLGLREFLLMLIVWPALEKSLFDGVDVVGIHSLMRSNSAIFGKW